jgi:rSAM/selenodomain-associated transferase 1
VGVFARAPVAGRAKTRLIPLLGAHGAAELQTALILDTARKVNELSRIAERWFFCAGGTYPDFAGHSEWTLAEQRGRDLGARVDRAFQTLLRLHEAAVIIGTDSPLLATRTLHRALTELRVCEAVLGPCPDGGFYLMGLRRPVPRIFRGVRWGTRFAFRDMRRNLVGAGLSCSILEPVPDVDRPADVLALARRLRKEPAKRQQAPALWRIVKARRLALELPAKRKARGSDN